MKRLILTLIVASIVAPAFAGQVRGYVKRNGTFVAPHQKSQPNFTRRDNFNSAGNFNPNKGTYTK
jgi:hypothetical protein